MKTKVTLLVIVGAMVCCLAGCISPGNVDPSVIGWYQQSMFTAGPQERSDDGLDYLRPAPGRNLLKLNVVDGKVNLSLQQAIMRTLAGNPEIRVVSFSPEISYEEIVQAAAAFDAIAFASATYDKDDTRGTSTGFGTGKAATRALQAGLRQRLITGAEYSTAFSMTRNWMQSGTSPRTSYSPTLELTITQPLLRNAWSEFNLASIRIARLNHKISMADFRAKVEAVITRVYAAYWSLVQARGNYDIQVQLLKKTEETLDRMKKRRKHDATEIEVKQAEASVAIRNASLLIAENTVKDAEDNLRQLISDKTINLVSDVTILPTTPFVTAPPKVNTTDQLLHALKHSPLLAQARDAISIAAISIKVAENQALPQLDLSASTSINGRARHINESMEKFGTANYISYMLQLSMEYPLGNRDRKAETRKAKYRHLQALAQMQNTADLIAVQVKEKVRQIETAYKEIDAQGEAVKASKAQLDALDAKEKSQKLSPEFLNVKLSAQQTLASAAQGLLLAQLKYNMAIIELQQVCGTILNFHQVELSKPLRALLEKVSDPYESTKTPPPADNKPIEPEVVEPKPKDDTRK